jgi:hypothetical protein
MRPRQQSPVPAANWIGAKVVPGVLAPPYPPTFREGKFCEPSIDGLLGSPDARSCAVSAQRALRHYA